MQSLTKSCNTNGKCSNLLIDNKLANVPIAGQIRAYIVTGAMSLAGSDSRNEHQQMPFSDLRFYGNTLYNLKFESTEHYD